MAERPVPDLVFLPDGCPDCGKRQVTLPTDPVPIPDDFDWSARDFEGFRRVMFEDMAASDPERQRWTSADMEMVIIETLAAGLDRASHTLDAVFAERFTQTARMPVSLVMLLKMIDGVDPAYEAVGAELTDKEIVKFKYTSVSQTEALITAMSARPALMDIARAAGMADLDRVESFILLEDLERFLDACPLIAVAKAHYRINGGFTVYEVVLLLNETSLRLHDRVAEIGPTKTAFEDWMLREKDTIVPPDTADHPLLLIDRPALQPFSIRTALSRIVTPLLPIGTNLQLIDGVRIGIFIRLCVHVKPNFYRSEVEAAVRAKLSAAPGGVFDPENLEFGTSIVLSDVEGALMSVIGVEGVLINRFQIVGRPDSDATASGVLTPRSTEALTLDPQDPSSETGYVVLKLEGGKVG